MEVRLFTPSDIALPKLLEFIEKSKLVPGQAAPIQRIIKESEETNTQEDSTVKAKERRTLQRKTEDVYTKEMEEDYEREEARKKRDIERKKKRREKELFEADSSIS